MKIAPPFSFFCHIGADFYCYYKGANEVQMRCKSDDKEFKKCFIYGVLALKSVRCLKKSQIWDLFRHTRAIHLYQHGIDLTLISQWLGYKNYTTTLVYAYADTVLNHPHNPDRLSVFLF